MLKRDIKEIKNSRDENYIEIKKKKWMGLVAHSHHKRKG